MSIYAIHDKDGVRLGSVMQVLGNPKDKRWVAYSIAFPGAPGQGFPTKRRAMEWLAEQKKETP